MADTALSVTSTWSENATKEGIQMLLLRVTMEGAGFTTPCPAGKGPASRRGRGAAIIYPNVKQLPRFKQLLDLKCLGTW
jgi:hypothetical protein